MRCLNAHSLAGSRVVKTSVTDYRGLANSRGMMDPVTASLKSLSAEDEFYLSARSIVGRSPVCNLQIPAPNVSAVHAQIVWDGFCWYLRDLNSRNGTFLDGRRLAADEQAQLRAGAKLGFGTTEHCYYLTNASAPRLMATPERGAPAIADADVLCLPSIDNCEVSIYSDSKQRWILESEHGERALEDQEMVVAGGRAWRISLPATSSRTREARSGEADLNIQNARLLLTVSRDGEHIEGALECGDLSVPLEYRVHLFLLLELARARIEDASSNLPDSEHGWVYRDDLLNALKIDACHLNIWMFRARQQLAKANIRGSGSIFERRVGTTQLRIGLDKFLIR